MLWVARWGENSRPSRVGTGIASFPGSQRRPMLALPAHVDERRSVLSGRCDRVSRRIQRGFSLTILHPGVLLHRIWPNTKIPC
jgi:hypothetical protein